MNSEQFNIGHTVVFINCYYSIQAFHETSGGKTRLLKRWVRYDGMQGSYKRRNLPNGKPDTVQFITLPFVMI